MFPKSDSKEKQRGQGIIKVANLFEKYKKTLRAPQKTVVVNFVVAVEDVLGKVLREDQCTYSPKSKTLSVHASGMLKTEIQLNKGRLIAEMRKALGEKSAPTDIL
jgi:hypothetical protein